MHIGLYHEILGKESRIDYWTIHSEPQIDIMGSVQQHAHDWICIVGEFLTFTKNKDLLT